MNGKCLAEGRWDKLGVWASMACAVHCLIAPLLFLAIPAFAGVWAHPASHWLMALCVIPLACLALRRGYRIHRSRWVAGLAVVGVVCILVGCVLPVTASAKATEEEAGGCTNCCPQVVTDEDGGKHLGLPPAAMATILGSALLVAGHIGNLRCCRHCARLGA